MKTFLTFAFLVAFGAFTTLSANAQQAPNLTQIEAALNAGNTELAATLAADAIQANPGAESRIITFVINNNPEAATNLAAKIGANSPDNFTQTLQTIRTALASTPNGAAIYNTLLANVATAAGGNNANPSPFGNIPQVALQRIVNTPALQNIPTENPGQTQGSGN